MNAQKFPKPPSILNWRTYWLLLFVVSVIWSLQVAGVFQGDIINQGGWNVVVQFLFAVFSPELSFDFLLLTLDATLKTFAYAVCGTFLCLVIGLIGGVLSSQVWWQSLGKSRAKIYNFLWLIIRAILAILRAIHELIWGLFFINIFGLDPLVAILAIAIPFGAITAKVFSELLDETPRQPLLALLNSGVSPLTALIYSLIPQAFPNLIAYGFYRFECSIRSATVLGIIGAGGLGYQIFLSLQSLRYEQVWTLMLALIVLSGSTDFLSGLLRQRLELPSRLDLNVLNLRRYQYQELENTPHNFTINLLLLGAIALLIFSFWYIKVDFGKFWEPRTAERFAGVIQDIFPPEWTDLHQVLTLSAQTLAMSILAMTGAGLGGVLLSFPAARNVKRGVNLPSKIRVGITRFLLLFSRAVPEPIWALIFLFVLFPGILPGAIALAIHNFGILGRLMAEVIENLDQRPLLCLKALGATNFQIVLYGILPATLPRFLAYILYRWEVCIRATVIVGLVGAGGLGRLLTEQLSSFDYNGLLATLIVFIGLTFMVDMISTKVRQGIRS